MKINLTKFNQYVEEGLLKKQQKDNLLIFCYTDQVQFKKKWDSVTTIARSLVVDTEGNIISKIFNKFFNINEASETKLEHLFDLVQENSYKIYTKIDGSLISLYHYRGQWRAASKASLDNEYIDYALKSLPDMSDVPKNYVFACEVCLPVELDGMRRAIKHEPGLYLLAAFDRYRDFKELSWEKAVSIWKGKKVDEYLYDFNQILNKAKEDKDIEGWVIVFNRPGLEPLRVKLKTFHYLKCFAFINNLNEKSIKEFIKSYGFEDTSWLDSFPEELDKEAWEIYNQIKQRYEEIKAMINYKFNLAYVVSDNRKEFAMRVKDNEHAWALFNLYDNKDITERLLEKI